VSDWPLVFAVRPALTQSLVVCGTSGLVEDAETGMGGLFTDVRAVTE
jgi:hypothetical protein